jgi:excisionase family DNA binding protein
MADMISAADAAISLGISPRQVLRLIDGGILPAQKIGASYVIRRSDLAKVPKNRKPGPKPKAKGKTSKGK